MANFDIVALQRQDTPSEMLNFLSRKVTNYLDVCTIPKQGNPQNVS